ncbi:hypothetical protein MN0502_19500 [Arthrobacter sp. MN05-02]|nr:hypothetical protein MN0502_19500 [Arthrobacter sp. MN05-02]
MVEQELPGSHRQEGRPEGERPAGEQRRGREEEHSEQQHHPAGAGRCPDARTWDAEETERISETRITDRT